MSKICEVEFKYPVWMRIVVMATKGCRWRVHATGIAGLLSQQIFKLLEWTANLIPFFATFHIPYAISKWRQYAVHAGHVATAAFNATSPERHATSARRLGWNASTKDLWGGWRAWPFVERCKAIHMRLWQMALLWKFLKIPNPLYQNRRSRLARWFKLLRAVEPFRVPCKTRPCQTWIKPRNII